MPGALDLLLTEPMNLSDIHLAGSKKSTTVRLRAKRSSRAHWLVRHWPRLSAIVLAELFVAPRVRVKPLVAPPGAVVEVLHVNKRRVVVHAFGEGPLVLLVHGWEGGASQMLRMAHGFVELGFRVALFDMPAHGDAPGWTTNLREFREILTQLARLMGPVHALVGHGLGGTASLLAAGQGLDVGGVVAVSPEPSLDFGCCRFARTFGLSPEGEEYLGRRLEKRTGMSRGEARLGMLPAPAVPTLIVHDVFDRVVPLRHSRELHDRWLSNALIETCGFGHRRILEAQSALRSIAAFLQGLPGASARGGLDKGTLWPKREHPASP
jgi:pimeloyl-ACP methyl ester carboxylesterase